jgi:hypothetical protein
MIFNKYNNYKEFSDDKINLEQLIDLIKEHPLRDEIVRLRNLKYKSDEYNTLKSKLISITPHGTFNDSKKGSIDNLSGYMYFDIDGITSTKELDETIKKLNDTLPLTFICKSCGGRGLAFLLKVNGLTKDNFENAHAFVRSVFQREGYEIDKAAGGLIRKWIISYDPAVLYNKNAEYVIDKEAFEKFTNCNRTSAKKVNKLESDVDTNDELGSDIIPFDKLCKMIKTESEFKGEIIGDFVIEEMQYYKILYPSIITDGNKHSTYIRIINALYWLNEDITQHQVFSYLYYVNSMAHPKMDVWKLKKMVTNFCDSIERTGDVKLKTRTKMIHFNKQSTLSKKDKQSMGASINGALRVNKTIESIANMKQQLIKKNIIPTQKLVANELGISLSTVKRNWAKKKIEISDLDLTVKKEPINLDILSEFDYVEEYYLNEEKPIVEDDFFDGFMDNE